MNWYKLQKLSQLDFINREDYEDEESYNAARYFSIGQDDEENPGICWVIMNNRIYKKQGGTHSSNFGIQARDHWRGWFDPTQKLLSIACPPEISGRSISDVPDDIIKILRNTFKGKYKIMIF